MGDIRITMAKKLGELKEASGLSYDDLERELKKQGVKVSSDSLKDYDVDEFHTKFGSCLKMKTATLLGLATFYGVSTDWLLGRTKDRALEPTAVGELSLSEKAVENIKGCDWMINMEGCGGKIMPPIYDGLKPSQVLSRLLENDEFWRTIGNISLWTTSFASEQMKLTDLYNPQEGGMPVVPGVIEPNPAMQPFSDSMKDMLLASAAAHFQEAAKKVLCDDTEGAKYAE